MLPTAVPSATSRKQDLDVLKDISPSIFVSSSYKKHGNVWSYHNSLGDPHDKHFSRFCGNG